MPPGVLWLTLVLLFGPKLMGAAWLLADGTRRRGFGGAGAVLRSVLAERSVLLAVTMVTQTKALAGLLLGVPSGWATQTRTAHRLPVRQILPQLREHLALGGLFAATAAAGCPLWRCGWRP
jgi:membrane glycosyltransferase